MIREQFLSFREGLFSVCLCECLHIHTLTHVCAYFTCVVGSRVGQKGILDLL